MFNDSSMFHEIWIIQFSCVLCSFPQILECCFVLHVFFHIYIVPPFQYLGVVNMYSVGVFWKKIQIVAWHGVREWCLKDDSEWLCWLRSIYSKIRLLAVFIQRPSSQDMSVSASKWNSHRNLDLQQHLPWRSKHFTGFVISTYIADHMRIKQL